MESVRFLHIPKTAGSTFACILLAQYGHRGLFHFLGEIDRDRRRWHALPDAAKRKTRLFLCHSPLVTGIDTADRCRLITLLRDPVNRVKSSCQHVYEGKSPYLRKRFPPYSFTLDELLDSGEIELDNLQVNMLAGTAGGGPKQSSPLTGGADLLETAWETLTRRMYCYGLLERFDTTILLFRKKLGWTKNPYYVRINRKRDARRLIFSDSHLEKIRELNRLDLALYERAAGRFQELAAEAVSQGELRAFERENTARQLATSIRWLPMRLLLKIERSGLGSG